MGSQQPFPLSKLVFMFVKSLAGPLSRRLLQRARTDTLFRRLIVLPPAHLYHFYEAKIKFRVMNLGKVLMSKTSFESRRLKQDHYQQVRMAAVPRLGEKLTAVLQAHFHTIFLSININI